MRRVYRESRHECDGQCRGKGQRQPRCHETGQQAHEGRTQHEREFVCGAFVGERRVQVRAAVLSCAAVLSEPAAVSGPRGQRHPPHTREGPYLGTAGTCEEGRGKDGGCCGESFIRGCCAEATAAWEGVGQGNQGEDRGRIQQGGNQQDTPLAPAVRQSTQDRCTEGRPDPHRPGCCSADRIRATHGGDERQGSDGQHGKRQAREQTKGKEGAAGQLRQPGEP
jgi:hypothetical protein